jgi:hypothetical protein
MASIKQAQQWIAPATIFIFDGIFWALLEQNLSLIAGKWDSPSTSPFCCGLDHTGTVWNVSRSASFVICRQVSINYIRIDHAS